MASILQSIHFVIILQLVDNLALYVVPYIVVIQCMTSAFMGRPPSSVSEPLRATCQVPTSQRRIGSVWAMCTT